MQIDQCHFRAIVRYMIYRGVKPTPTRLNLALGREHLGSYTRREINGRECKARAEVLTQHGWQLRPWVRGQQLGHWTPPADWQEHGSPQQVINEVRASLNLAPYDGEVR